MPELPEAETIARDLHARTAGARVAGVTISKRDILAPGTSPARLSRVLEGRTLQRVGRRGKNLVLEFDDEVRLVVNLGMTGRVVTSDSPRAADLSHVAARLHLVDGRALLYDDARRFGRLDLRDARAWATRDAELGIEPLSDAFTADRMFRITRHTIVPIRNLLLDQQRVAGVGNIYANEALFRAAIRPTRRSRRITRKEAALLCTALRDVLTESIEARGTTFSDYRDGNGEEGAFEAQLRVYGREGMPCIICGTPIKRVVLTNRSAFYCPVCQH